MIRSTTSRSCSESDPVGRCVSSSPLMEPCESWASLCQGTSPPGREPFCLPTMHTAYCILHRRRGPCLPHFPSATPAEHDFFLHGMRARIAAKPRPAPFRSPSLIHCCLLICSYIQDVQNSRTQRSTRQNRTSKEDWLHPFAGRGRGSK